ncbi:transposase [Chryseobacterium glaciei]|uniref:Transposase n=1 Tax=Chryseobacterium glaciei TaxID=1685010 RepID=A0A172Y1B3_9FLAO|nr:transposase [Chryseobacterium glaciei]ANF52896.1 transposase [Chryseobacterium glaciei]
MERVTNFKKINIGLLIHQKVKETTIEVTRICSFLKSTEEEIEEMYISKSLDAEILMRWSKLLKYDFFRIYSQHLILYAPPSREVNKVIDKEKTVLPQFRKNFYTKEVIDFILELIENGEKTRQQVIHDYLIPKATLHKWINKYKK